jgi:hypothetical protein
MRHPIALVVLAVLSLAPARVEAQRGYNIYQPPGGVPPTSFSLAQVVDGGQYVVLEDGSRWEIAPDDRPIAAAWTRDASIVISVIGAPTGDYDTRLTNVAPDLDRQSAERHAAARFAGRVRRAPADSAGGTSGHSGGD